MKTFLAILLLAPSLSWSDSQKKALKEFCNGYYENILKQELEILNKGFEALKNENEENIQWIDENYSKLERANEIMFDQGYKWSVICSNR